jgi:hypothetical protein
MKSGTYRAIEGVIELKFDTGDGDIEATRTEQFNYLKLEKFNEDDINEYLNYYTWDENGKCIGS